MIPTKPPPTFKDDERRSKEFLDFVSKCLVKNPEERATATQLLQARIGAELKGEAWDCLNPSESYIRITSFEDVYFLSPYYLNLGDTGA